MVIHTLKNDFFWLRAVALLLVSCISLGCADNVSNRIEAVKADIASAISAAQFEPTQKPSVTAKASSVSASVAYDGAAAKAVSEKFDLLASTLGYERKVTEVTKQRIFCHRTEKARFIWLETINPQPLQIVLGVSITGWSADAEMCEAASKAKTS